MRRAGLFRFAATLKGTLQNLTFVLVACLCAALVGTEIWQLWRVHEANIQQTDVVTSNTAQVMAEQAETTLQTADTIVASLVERVEAEGLDSSSKERFYRLMTSMARALPSIHEMGITDAQGNALVKSLVPRPVGMNYAEREYFQYHSTHPDRSPFIGERIKSKVDGSDNITVTRRYNDAQGNFAGVVVTSVSMAFLQQLSDKMQARSGGVMSLITDDGTVLTRSPMPAGGWMQLDAHSQIRQHLSAQPGGGTATYISDTYGEVQRGSFQHLRHFPMSELVAQSEWDIQASWRTAMRLQGFILLCVLVVVAVLGRRTAKANRLLNEHATQDGLTGLANRRAFDVAIQHEVRRAARSGQPVSVIMLDVDHFKGYNDAYGHPRGDECLRLVARSITGCLRRTGEVAARYGGEEIAVILPGSDAAHAYKLAETMRSALRREALPHAHNVGGVVTFSAGVATWEPRQRILENEYALIEEADAALYAAKVAGRDTVRANQPRLARLHAV